MDTISESLLSAELQELYLQNKDWLSQVLFLEDENRFFQKLFVKRMFFINKNHGANQVNLITENLLSLEKRTATLKDLVIQHQHLLAHIIKDPSYAISLDTIEQHSEIKVKVRHLLYLDRVLKSELFTMVEGVKE